MTKIDDGGPAFATGNPEQGGYAGMSLRAYFAGQAVVGLAHYASINDAVLVANVAVAFADALIERLEKT